MNLINKINRLNKIPQLLNKKREAEEESEKRRKKENSQKKSGFSFEHDDAFIKKRPESEEPTQKPPVSADKRKTTKEGVGNYIDVII